MIVLVVCLVNTQIALSWTGDDGQSEDELQIRDTVDGVELTWTSRNTPALSLSYSATNAFVNDQQLTFEVTGTPALSIDNLVAQPIVQPATDAPALQQQSLNEFGQWSATNTFISNETLHDAPARIVREGVMNGRRYLVVGISALYNDAGATMRAASFTARVHGARRINNIESLSIADDAIAFNASDIPQPQAFTGDAWRIVVVKEGIQRITGAQLANAGVPMNRIPADQVHVLKQNDELAIEVNDADRDGLLSMADEIRFYAPRPGDRWNRTSTYWLTFDSTAGLRMAAQSTPQAGQTTHIAWMESAWQDDRVYDSLLPGPDDDHWFSGRLDANSPPIQATLSSALPFAAGDVRVTVKGSSTQPAALQLAANGVTFEQTTPPEKKPSGAHASDWSFDFTLPATEGNTEVAVQLNSNGTALALEDVAWRAPVTLDFKQKGAAFTSLPGMFTYQLQGVPAGAALYDVTDAMHPQIVTLSGESQFSAGPASHNYVQAAEGTLFAPAISKRDTVDLSKPVNARAIYIAPAALHHALQPLILHRLQNGWRAAIIDTQAIYDQWSGGQVSPDAIRDFLRNARATWRVKPYAVILVGDGNYDPLNNTGSAPPTLIPPYLANVDRQMGETACESCFAQLDGADPLNDILPDLIFGRLPVKDAYELSTLVNKIIAYETQPAGAWMWRNVFITDNTRHADGSYDDAGDFDAFSRRAMALQPAGVGLDSVIFEPLYEGNSPWYERDAALAHSKTLALMNEGAAVVNYTGHGLTNQWAYTAPNAGSPYLLTTQDAEVLQNGSRLPVVLSMACLTGSFHLPSAGGNSIDEQMVLAPNGGAIASWSSAGLGILFSAEYLQRGFYKALWQNPGALTIGSLAQASLLELFQNAPCCDEPLRTHALLGDPLTPLRVQALPARVYFPLAAR